ncbi:INO80 complex subunit C isoform X2 [Xenopus laevis]|uniref:INO80 complex subunit C isoform X2 n=1 Tax=Xenopus laevis TaxID=8355 RepID=A0A8J1L1Y4_XENLA|nr:INO80 complex subunit C isoform X2 [Xenopus laevis]
MSENNHLNNEGTNTQTEIAIKPLPFKQPQFLHSGIGGAAAGKKNRTWKNLKQILALERALSWQLNDPSYFSIDAPPSCKPAKKYSDISGLPAASCTRTMEPVPGRQPTVPTGVRPIIRTLKAS